MHPLRNTLIIIFMVILSVVIIILTSARDDAIKPNRFDCRMLIGGWHPDVPKQIVEQCRKGITNDANSKTSYR
jgi:hypothetical protein